jgi:hypothetical protein
MSGQKVDAVWVSKRGHRGRTPAQRRKEARLQLDAQWPTVCQALLEKATGGDIVALQTVMEMAGIGAPDRDAAKRRQVRRVSFVKKKLAELQAKT